MALTAEQSQRLQNVLVVLGGLSQAEAAKPENLTRENVEKALANLALLKPELGYKPESGFSADYQEALTASLGETKASSEWGLFKMMPSGELIKTKFPNAPQSVINNPSLLVALVDDPAYIGALGRFFKDNPVPAPAQPEAEKPAAQEPAVLAAEPAAPQEKGPTVEQIAAQKAAAEAAKRQAELQTAETIVEGGVNALSGMVNTQIKAQKGADLLQVRALALPDLDNGKLDNRAVQEFLDVLMGPMGLNMGWEDGYHYTPERGQQILGRLKSGPAPAFVAKMSEDQRKQYEGMVKGGMGDMFIGSMDKLYAGGLLSQERQFETSPLGMAPAAGQLLGWLKAEWPQVFGMIDGLVKKYLGMDLDALALAPSAPAPAPPNGSMADEPVAGTAFAPASPGGGITIATMVQVEPKKPSPSLDFREIAGNPWTDAQPSNVYNPRSDLLTADTAGAPVPPAPAYIGTRNIDFTENAGSLSLRCLKLENGQYVDDGMMTIAELRDKKGSNVNVEAVKDSVGNVLAYRLTRYDDSLPGLIEDVIKSDKDPLLLDSADMDRQMKLAAGMSSGNTTLDVEKTATMHDALNPAVAAVDTTFLIPAGKSTLDLGMLMGSKDLQILSLREEIKKIDPNSSITEGHYVANGTMTLEQIHQAMGPQVTTETIVDAEGKIYAYRLSAEGKQPMLFDAKSFNSQMQIATEAGAQRTLQEIAVVEENIAKINERIAAANVAKQNPTPVSASAGETKLPEGQTTQPSWPGTVQPPMKGGVQNAAPMTGEKPNPEPLPQQTGATQSVVYAAAPPKETPTLKYHPGHEAEKIHDLAQTLPNAWWEKKWEGKQGHALRDFANAEYKRIHGEDANMYTKDAFLFVHNNPQVHPRGVALITENRIISDLQLTDRNLASRPQFFVEGKGDHARIIAVGRDRDAHFSLIDVTDDMNGIKARGYESYTTDLDILRSSAYPYEQFGSTKSLHDVALRDMAQADKKLSKEFKAAVSGNYKFEEHAPKASDPAQDSSVQMTPYTAHTYRTPTSAPGVAA